MEIETLKWICVGIVAGAAITASFAAAGIYTLLKVWLPLIRQNLLEIKGELEIARRTRR